MSSLPPPLLSAPAGAGGKPTRSASAVVAKASRGFQVFRIDGFSWTKSLPGGERITSEQFYVGGRLWHIDYYPNGTSSSDSDDGSSSSSMALYLRMQNSFKKERVRAQFKFSLLDLAGGDAAYELPAETGVFRSTGTGHGGDPAAAGDDDPGCGYAAFIAGEELERRREVLLKEDCLAIRCDVGVTEVSVMAVAVGGGGGGPMNMNYGGMMPQSMMNYGQYGGGYGGGYGGVYGGVDGGGGPMNMNYGGMMPQSMMNYGQYGGVYGGVDGGGESNDDEHGGGGGGSRNKGGSRRGEREPDDKEYIRRCLSAQRPK